jgi:hypothetical protein
MLLQTKRLMELKEENKQLKQLVENMTLSKNIGQYQIGTPRVLIDKGIS